MAVFKQSNRQKIPSLKMTSFRQKFDYVITDENYPLCRLDLALFPHATGENRHSYREHRSRLLIRRLRKKLKRDFYHVTLTLCSELNFIGFRCRRHIDRLVWVISNRTTKANLTRECNLLRFLFLILLKKAIRLQIRATEKVWCAPKLCLLWRNL